MFRQQMGSWIAAAAVALVLFGIGLVLTLMIDESLGVGILNATNEDSIGNNLLSFLVSFVLNGFYMTLVAGMANMALKQSFGEAISIGDVFSGFPKIGAIVVASFCTILLVYIGAIFCLLPGLIANGLLILAPIIILLQDKGPFQGMSMSWSALKPFFWPAVGFGIVVPLLSGLGALACLVGILFTFPLYPISIALLYKEMFLRNEEFTYSTPPAGPNPPFDSNYPRGWEQQ